MARPTRTPQACSPVSLEFVCGDDVGLAKEGGCESPALDLVAQGGGADAELDCGLGQGEHGLELHAFAVALTGRPALVVDVAPAIGASAGRGSGVAGEVGVDLVEPAFEGLASALITPDADLIGVEAAGVLPTASEGALELAPAVGPFLRGRAHLFEFVAKLRSGLGGDHGEVSCGGGGLLGDRAVLALGEQAIGEGLEGLAGLVHDPDVAPVDLLDRSVLVVLNGLVDALDQGEGSGSVPHVRIKRGAGGLGAMVQRPFRLTKAMSPAWSVSWILVNLLSLFCPALLPYIHARYRPDCKWSIGTI